QGWTFRSLRARVTPTRHLQTRARGNLWISRRRPVHFIGAESPAPQAFRVKEQGLRADRRQSDKLVDGHSRLLRALGYVCYQPFVRTVRTAVMQLCNTCLNATKWLFPCPRHRGPTQTKDL